MKDLSIIIINYKTPSLLRQCIKSILRAKLKLNYEIIVIDNNSRDNTVQMIEDDFYETTKLIANKKNLGFPKAVNQGIVEAKKNQSKYILLLNPDITVLPNSIELIFDFMEKNKDIAVLGPQLINPDGSIQNSCFTQFTTPAIVLYRRTIFGKLRKAKGTIDNFLMANWDHKTPRNVAWILGSCMFVRMLAIKKVGPMDERFFMYMEDVDWCRRFLEIGYRIYYWPRVKMVHYYQRASATEGGLLRSMFNRQTRIHIASALKYFLKYWKRNDTISEKL
ncbi:MAG: glycosyltransferase family 2 protein [Patescibacteria group bacterium]